MSALRRVGSWANDQDSSEGEDGGEEFDVNRDDGVVLTNVPPNEERPPYREVSHADNISRNKDGFSGNSSNNNSYYGGNYRRGDRDQNRDRNGYSNNRDHNPNYRRKGSGEYRPNIERNPAGAYRQRQQGEIENTTMESSQQPSVMSERPKLELKPRTAPLEIEPSRDPNIFGIGKAREAQEDPMIEKLDLHNRELSGQTDIDKDVPMESQSRTYVNKGKFFTDRRFNQDKSKGGGRGNTKGRERKPRNSEESGKVSHQKTFESQNKRISRAPPGQTSPVMPENLPSRAETLRKANPFGALDESSSEEED